MAVSSSIFTLQFFSIFSFFFFLTHNDCLSLGNTISFNSGNTVLPTISLEEKCLQYLEQNTVLSELMTDSS